jgi:hypothetical protein
MARCQESGVEIIHNWAVIAASVYQPDSSYPFNKLPLIEGAASTTIDGVPCQIWQRPNTYRADGNLARKGQTRKVHQAVKQALGIPARAYVNRQYYDDPVKAAKVRNREWGLELYIFTKTHPWGQLWEVWPAFE